MYVVVAVREVAPHALHFPAAVEVHLSMVFLGAVDAAAEDGPLVRHLFRLLPVRFPRRCEQCSWLPLGKLLIVHVEFAEHALLVEGCRTDGAGAVGPGVDGHVRGTV
eukprot:9573663-Lingulodinium_polyedra.AAC.1